MSYEILIEAATKEKLDAEKEIEVDPSQKKGRDRAIESAKQCLTILEPRLSDGNYFSVHIFGHTSESDEDTMLGSIHINVVEVQKPQ